MSLVDDSLTRLENGSENPDDNKDNKPKVRLVSLWRNWEIASLMIAVAISWVGFGLVAPLRTLYARSEGASGGEVGLMGAAYLFSSFIFLFPFGWLSDRYSRTALIVGGLFAHMLITLAYLPFTSGEAFVALRFLEGISSAAVMPAARAMLADVTPPGRNGEAFGMMSVMITFGMFAGPPIGTFMAEGLGFAPVYLLAGFVFIPAIIMILWAFRKRPSNNRAIPAPKAKITASENGLQAAGTFAEKLWTGPIIIGCLIRIALSLGMGLAITIWSLFMTDLGFSLTLIGITYTVYSIPMILIGSRAGRFSDRYGRLGMMFGGSLLLGLIWISYGWITTFAVFLLVGTIEGILDTIARSANDGYLADHSPAHSRGRAQGLFNAATQFGSLIGALGSGFLYELGRGVPFIVMGSLQIILVLISLALAVFFQKRKSGVMSLAS